MGIKYWYTHAHSSPIHNNQKVEIAQMPINGWVDKQKVVDPYSRALFGHKKE